MSCLELPSGSWGSGFDPSASMHSASFRSGITGPTVLSSYYLIPLPQDTWASVRTTGSTPASPRIRFEGKFFSD
ncbi:MAG: hypothetical protein C0433_10365 [Cyclobacterium sp.]|nr:hypothetical protein [Cyclobacterium sp.]